MGLPSASFSRGYSCNAQFSFSGEFSTSQGDLSWGSEPSEFILNCIVTDGTNTKTAAISRMAPSTFVDWDYVAGTTVTCSMQEQYHHIRSAGTVAFAKLRIRATLMPQSTVP